MTEPPAPPRLRGDCPTCGPGRWSDIVASFSTEDSNDEGDWSHTHWRTMRCRGCDTVFIQKSVLTQYDLEIVDIAGVAEPQVMEFPRITHWPAVVARLPPAWLAEVRRIDHDLDRLLAEIYVALNNDLRVLAAMGIRTLFDRASELLQVDAALPFADKLRTLVTLGHVGTEEKEILDALTDAGSAAAHRGWRPEAEELGTMMDIVEAFIHRAFILTAAAKRMRAAVPTKPPRRNASQPGRGGKSGS